MGWLYTHKPESMSVRAFFESHFTSENEYAKWVLLDCAVVRLRTAYLATRRLNKLTQEECVFATVCHLDYIRNDYYNFGYKDIDEDSGPYAAEAPERILKLLSPTDNENALRWREQCWGNIQKKKGRPTLRKGMIIRHKAKAIRFQDGKERRYFEVIKRGRYRSLSDGQLCRLSHDDLNDMEVCSREAAYAALWNK